MATEGKDGNGKKQKEAKTQKQRTSLRNPGVDTEPIWEVNAASISHGRKQSYYGKSMLLAYPTANSNRHEEEKECVRRVVPVHGKQQGSKRYLYCPNRRCWLGR